MLTHVSEAEEMYTAPRRQCSINNFSLFTTTDGSSYRDTRNSLEQQFIHMSSLSALKPINFAHYKFGKK
jgi:hypothetical protein